MLNTPTERSSERVPLFCTVHVFPPSTECCIIPYFPTFQRFTPSGVHPAIRRARVACKTNSGAPSTLFPSVDRGKAFSFEQPARRHTVAMPNFQQNKQWITSYLERCGRKFWTENRGLEKLKQART